ncbi:MAG: hypothetical protein CL768_02730 [Chloroflexi bacterium]|nr:hypothetical protein [Chloroflexota bacterium]
MNKQEDKKSQIAILGAGLAGLAAGHKLNKMKCEFNIYEKSNFVGGHAATHKLGDFIFDDGPHVSFTKRPEIKKFLSEAVEEEFIEHKSKVLNYWKGHWVKHPAQCFLYGLPTETIKNCLIDYVNAYKQASNSAQNYAEWCFENLGKTFSEEFVFKYTKKYWTLHAKELSTDWIGPRIYPPSPEEVIKGALEPPTTEYHYLSEFRYPTNGGFAAYLKGLNTGNSVNLNHEVVSIDIKSKLLTFANGKKSNFTNLISSLPLPELIKLLKNVPEKVKIAANQLKCSSVALISLGINRAVDWPEAHWIYFYDYEISFSRIHFPHLLSPHNSPPGTGSIQVETYYSDEMPLPENEMIDRTIKDLIKTGIIKKEDEILVSHQHNVKYANVIFDLNRAENLAIVNDYLNETGIERCGRYGDWEYHWTDDSIVSGWDAVDRLNIKLK